MANEGAIPGWVLVCLAGKSTPQDYTLGWKLLENGIDAPSRNKEERAIYQNQVYTDRAATDDLPDVDQVNQTRLADADKVGHQVFQGFADQ